MAPTIDAHDQMLQSLPLLRGVAPESLAALSPRCLPRAVDRGQYAWFEGQTIEAVTFVIRGRLKLVKPECDGTERILYTVDPGQPASFDALRAATFHADSAVGAARETVVLEVSRRAWHHWVSDDDAYRRNLGEACVHHHLRLMDRFAELTNDAFDSQLASLLFRHAAIPPTCTEPARALSLRQLRDIDRAEIASLLGVRYETVSRQLNAWQRDGRIALEGRDVRIVDGGWLEALAGDVPPSWRVFGSLADRRTRPRCTTPCQACPAFRALGESGDEGEPTGSRARSTKR